jgi:SAM-dependent methyltransferase
VDIVLSADRLPFADNSLRAIYGINVFHHLSRPREFFREILRVVNPGGGVVLIEPFYGLVASWVFKNLHKSEGFEPEASDWDSPIETGPFSKANQALSYIVFKRDLSQFKKEFPELEVVFMRPHTQLWYILSGGVNFRQLLPDRLTSVARLSEQMLSPLNHWIALQQTIVLRKK